MRVQVQAFVALLLASSAAAGPKPLSITVKTTSGTYTGFVNSSAPDVNQWLGIPFGKPPLGKLRFMPPEKAPNHGTGLSATAYKPICFQNSGTKQTIYWQLLPEYLNRDPESEDCLYLNIWAPRKLPATGKKKLPVIVWIVGGGFKEGGGHADYQVPDQWVQRMRTHIVVTFKYAAPFHWSMRANFLPVLATDFTSSASLARRPRTRTLGYWIPD